MFMAMRWPSWPCSPWAMRHVYVDLERKCLLCLRCPKHQRASDG